MIVAKMSTSGETARNGSDVEQTKFGKDLSSLSISLAAVTLAKCLTYLSLIVLIVLN